MILTWCLYAVVVALLVAAAAAAADRALRLYDLPTRWVWLGAMIVSVGLPAAYGLVLAVGGPPPRAVVPADLPVIELGGLSTPATSAGGSAGFTAWLIASVPWIWLAASLVVVGWLWVSKRRLRDSEADWRPVSTGFAGKEPVYRTETFGPAVVGFADPRIVLPEWVAELDEERRRLVILHEREHLRHRDPVLVLAGWLHLVAVPWLVPLWWQFRRLRLAIEQDCDRRVVRRTGDVRGYGRLLLEAEELAAGTAGPLATTGGSFLGARIRALVESTPPFRGLRAAGAALALTAALLAAGMVPPPGGALANTGVRSGAEARLASSLQDRLPRLVDRARFESRARRADRRGPGAEADTVVTTIHVTRDGTVDGAYVAGADVSPTLRRSALEVAAGARFRPATREDRPVPTWIAIRIPFGG